MIEWVMYFFIAERRGFNYMGGGSCTESLDVDVTGAGWVQKQH